MNNKEWLEYLYERCGKGCNKFWARGYACGLKDAGVITTEQLVRFLAYLDE